MVLLFVACVFADGAGDGGGGAGGDKSGDSKIKKWDGVYEKKDGKYVEPHKYIKGKMSGN